jgi:AcrR family transcriptional regulator
MSAGTTSAQPQGRHNRRDELLRIAGRLFAQRGFTNTTVRDIADAAGIQSGSLYHHFDSKETMVDELLSTFQTALFATYDDIVTSDLDARAKVDAVVRASFDAIDQHHDEVAIFQNDAAFLLEFERFGYLREHNKRFRDLWMALLEEGTRTGALRADLDPELTYRFIRDTVWVAVRWYRPGRDRTVQEVADQYLAILFDGITIRES